MEYLTTQFNRITNHFRANTNLELIGHYHYEPKPPRVNEVAISNHKRTLSVSFKQFLTSTEIKLITQDYRRSEMTEDAILADFFANDVEKHDIPFDYHVERGLQAMADAFRPPQLCMPAHINDVEHHYPYKWQVNSEAPFSTDKYFLDNRKPYGDFFDKESLSWKNYVNPEDMQRRIPVPSEQTLAQVTPPKFGFQKGQVFSWVRRWHHIVKSNFTDLTDLASSSYIKDRFVFPMLLHTKTAIVKQNDPNKMRTIWGCSKAWIIADTMLYWELLAYYKLNPGKSPMLWGYETFTGGWLRLNAELHNGLIRSSFLTTDWSRFDKRAYFSLIHRIMAIIRTYLDFNNGYLPNELYPDTRSEWSSDKAQRLEFLFLWTLENLFQAPIVLPDGRMYRRRFAGIPSGLFITQLLDSWYNYTMLATILSALGFDPKSCIIKVQGDDSIIRLYVLIPPHSHEEFLLKMQEIADYYFKSVISTQKSEIGNRLNGREVLSYRNNNGQPYRDEILMLAQFYHTKAKDPSPEITMAQAIGFAYAACGNNRRVHDCLEDIYLYYKRKGYTPSPAGLTVTFGDSPDLPNLPFNLDSFPKIEDVRAYFLHTSYRNEEQQRRTWPAYFSHPPCERP
uniref:Putative RNA-dependent RNA polymerase n=2 Tax=Heterobasidion partitivirus 4 TaxID=942042 RepID=E7E1F0_9VIRU|nr:putative RNA-dependent RNA polymerase [Heterobasidion partitivirus 4]